MGYYGTQFPEFKANKNLDLIYDFMCKLGYEMSTEEKQLQDGTHELYVKNDE
jgi:ParB family chromosome partitioning protein